MLERRMQLERLTTLRVGGVPLRYFRPADEQKLRRALEECRRRALPWRVLGGGWIAAGRSLSRL